MARRLLMKSPDEALRRPALGRNFAADEHIRYVTLTRNDDGNSPDGRLTDVMG
jgi:hypothetical protein